MMGRLRRATKCAGGKVEHGTPSFSWRSLSWLVVSQWTSCEAINQAVGGGWRG